MKKLLFFIGLFLAFQYAFAQNIDGTRSATWKLQFQFPIVARNAPIACDGEYFYVGSESPTFYKYTVTGEEVGTFTISGISSMNTLCYDGEYFYGSNNNSTIWKINMSANPPVIVSTISPPAGMEIANITFDPDADDENGGFWVGGTEPNCNLFVQIKRNGDEIRRFVAGTISNASTICGTTYDNVSLNGPYLWALEETNNILSYVVRNIYKINLTNGHIEDSYNLYSANLVSLGSRGGGMCLVQNIAGATWSLCAAVQRNAIFGWDLASTISYNLDIGVSSLNLPALLPYGDHYYIIGKVRNYGATVVNSYKLSYQIDNGEVFTIDITGTSLGSGQEMNYTHYTPVAPVLGGHTIKVWTSLPNGTQDEYPGNDTLTFSYTIYNSISDLTVPRCVLLEGFTSSSCPPCVAGNIHLTNVLAQNDAQGGKYTLIKYQMSWPGSGDPYYTTEGGTRRSLYGLNSVPYLYLDGTTGMNTGSLTNQQLVNLQNDTMCHVEVSGEYQVEGKTVNATINVKSTVDFNEGNNLKLFVAIVEKVTHKNKTTNGETEFAQVMKKFMPNAGGITLGNLKANELVTKTLSWDFKGEYRLPANALSPIDNETEHSVEDFNNLEVVAWVQNNITKAVYNSCTAIKGVSATTLVSFEVTGGNGSLSATVNGAPITSGDLVNTGETVEFTAVPNENFEVKEWKLNNEIIPNNTTNSYAMMTSGGVQNVSVEFIDPQSIKNNNSTTFQLFPNPVNNILTIARATSAKARIEIYNSLGTIIHSFEMNETEAEINVSALPSGIYWLRLINDNSCTTRHFVKQ